MNARIEISVEVDNAENLEDRIREIAGQSLNWTWTSAGSHREIARHVQDIERHGQYVATDGGNGWTLEIVVTK